MRAKSKGFILAGVLGALAFLMVTTLTLPGWGKEETTGKQSWMVWDERYWPTKPVRGGYIRTAAPAYIGLMNPNHWPVNDWVSMGYFYEKLFYTDGKYRPLVPWTVESWEYIDPLTCIMKLKKGINFHDGSQFNAEAVKYQIDWIKDRKNGAWSRAWIEPIESVEVVDEYTVKWRFTRPWAGFLGIIANVPGYVLSAEALKGDVALREAKKLAGKAERAKKRAAKAVQKAKKAAAKGGEEAEKALAKAEKAKKKAFKLEEQARKMADLAKRAKPMDTHPVGTGPYILEDASPGNYLKLKRNPNWWFGNSIGHPDMPYLDGILVNVIPDPSVRLANLRAGKIDFLGIDPSQYDMVKNDPNLQIFVYPGNHSTALRFNLAKGPCKDIRVRKAISHAIDRKALIAGTMFGLGRLASCMYPDDHWAHNPDLKPVPYDPEKAKKLLAEAGYSKGLTIKGYVNMAYPTWQNIAEAVKAMLGEVGIDWKVEILDPAATSDRMKNLEYDLAQGGWVWIFDPDLMATGLYHPDGGFNYGRSHNEKAIELIMAGRKELDLEKRTKIYYELEKVLYDNYEDAWIAWPMMVTALRKNVLGWNHDMFLKDREAYWWSHPMWFKEGHP